MSQHDLLRRRASVKSRNLSIRNTQDFHVYMHPWGDGGVGGGVQLDVPGFNYYSSKGFNFTESHYQISSGTYNKSPPGYSVESQVQTMWTSGSLAPWSPYMDLWWFDTETASYTGKAADAATDLAGAQNGVNWTKQYWALYTTNPVYVGNYGNSTGIRTQGIIVAPFNYTSDTFASLQNDNDVNGYYVANTWDWMGPELYQTNIDSWTAGLDWLCNEKRRMGIMDRKLIPFIWRHGSPTTISTYNFTLAQLEYAYSRPECNGIVQWGTQNTDPAPVYYDASPWMQATLDFLAKYNIQRGNPF